MKTKEKEPYPRIRQLGLTLSGDSLCPFIRTDDLKFALTKKWGRASIEKFHKLFGIQTCPVGGMYPWDVEEVLERMASGKKTGTQSEAGWD